MDVEKENLAVVQRGYAAFGSGDVPGLLACLAPHVEWDNPGRSSIPWAGRFVGHEGVTRYLELVSTSLEIESFEPAAFIADGDRVIVLGTERARVRRSGAVFEQQWAHSFVLADGKIARFREYGDTAAVAAAVGE